MNAYCSYMQGTVGERGQVTIPKQLRERLGIDAGTVLDFEADNGRLVAVKASANDPVDAAYGVLSLGTSTDEFVAEIRGRPDQQ